MGLSRARLQVRMSAAVLAAAGAVAALSSAAPADARQASASDGTRTLTVSQVDGLAAGGQVVTVTGRGYDVNKGIYVALCVVPQAGQPPTPCGGGATTEGSTGASYWISSNPPSYGEGLAQPYGAGGTFSVTLNVVAALNADVDCRNVACAVVTRNDHIRAADRGQDVVVPVTFGAGAGSAGGSGIGAAGSGSGSSSGGAGAAAGGRSAATSGGGDGAGGGSGSTDGVVAAGDPAAATSGDLASGSTGDPGTSADLTPGGGSFSDGSSTFSYSPAGAAASELQPFMFAGAVPTWLTLAAIALAAAGGGFAIWWRRRSAPLRT